MRWRWTGAGAGTEVSLEEKIVRERGWRRAGHSCCPGVRQAVLTLHIFLLVFPLLVTHTCSNTRKRLEHSALLVISMVLRAKGNVFLLYNVLEGRDHPAARTLGSKCMFRSSSF